MTVVESANSFFAKYEESNFDLCNGIVQSFITACKQLNPNMNHMAGSDWVSMLLNDYSISYSINESAEHYTGDFNNIQIFPKEQQTF